MILCAVPLDDDDDERLMFDSFSEFFAWVGWSEEEQERFLRELEMSALPTPIDTLH